MQVHVGKFSAKIGQKGVIEKCENIVWNCIFICHLNDTTKPRTMNLANRMLESIQKNIYTRLVFWFILGSLAALLVVNIVRLIRHC